MLLNVCYKYLAWAMIGIAACGSPSSDASQELNAEAIDMYQEKGSAVVGSTFAVLSSSLQKTIKEEGVSPAIRYCNLSAYPLVDSLSEAHHATIRRTSTKVRNPRNTASEAEKSVLNLYEVQIAAGEKPKPEVRRIDENAVGFYAPIYTNDLCLKCHGSPGNDILEDDWATLRELYPDDAAFDYDAGDFRGIWSIAFMETPDAAK